MLLLAASAAASGVSTAETDAIGGGSSTGRIAGTLSAEPARRPLRPRWIEPRRLEPAPRADALAGDPPAAAPPEAAAALPSVVGSVARQAAPERAVTGGTAKDWRRAARIVIHGEGVNDELSALTADLLTTLGARAVERRRVRTSSDADQIRYFDAADERMARELAAALEPEFGRVPVRDFTAYRPSPESGLLEMWLR